MVEFKAGRLPAHPDTPEHARIKFAAIKSPTTMPAIPSMVDYVSKVTNWPMYGNDTIGDCTFAAAGHMEEAWTQYGQGKAVVLADSDIISGYSAVSGYNPKTGANDNGCVMQDVLSYWRKTGIGGHKILAFAEVNIHDMNEVKQALYMFGHVYVGINFPNTAMDQFNAGKPWDYTRGAYNEGGHAIDLGLMNAGANHQVITWGQAQQMTQAFWDHYVEEAWIVISQEWVDANGNNPAGLDVNALNAAFEELTQTPGPFPVSPNPQPTPTPTPDPTPTPNPNPDNGDGLLEKIEEFVKENAALIKKWLKDLGF